MHSNKDEYKHPPVLSSIMQDTRHLLDILTCPIFHLNSDFYRDCSGFPISFWFIEGLPSYTKEGVGTHYYIVILKWLPINSGRPEKKKKQKNRRMEVHFWYMLQTVSAMYLKNIYKVLIIIRNYLSNFGKATWIKHASGLNIAAEIHLQDPYQVHAYSLL